MARALSIARSVGRYHVTARGNERKDTFHRGTDGSHFVKQAGREDRVGFSNRQGDWGRDAAWWLGRRAGRLRLAEF